jgi:hypothetical protein
LYKLSHVFTDKYGDPTFTASFRIFYEWRDHGSKEFVELGGEMDVEPPEVTFVNMVEIDALDWEKKPRVLDQGKRLLYAHRKYLGKFTSIPQLHNFPFDLQRLSLVLLLKQKTFKNRGLKILPVEFQNLDPLPEWHMMVPELDESQCIQKDPIGTISIVILRKPGYYVRVGLAMLGMLTTLGFASYALPIDGLGDRLETVLSVTFTVLSLRFSVQSNHGNVNYATAMDVYTMACNMLLAWMVVAHAVVSGGTSRALGEDAWEKHHNTIEFADSAIFAATLVFWVVFNLAFFKYYTHGNHKYIEMDAGCEEQVGTSTFINYTGDWAGDSWRPF